MRCVAIAALAACALFFQTAPSMAQRFKRPKKGRQPATQKAPREAKEAPAESQYVPQISEIAGKDLDEWIKEIGARDPSARENAIRTVLLFGPEQARKAVPALITELKKDSFDYPLDLSVRTTAAMALGTILSSVKDPDAQQVKDAVKLLTRMLISSQDIVKYRAAQTLALFGPAAKEAIPKLLTVMRDPLNWETRQAAAAALARVAVILPPPKGKTLKLTRDERTEMVKVIVDLAYRANHDSSSQVRLSALHSLAFLGRFVKAVNSPDAQKVMEKDLAHAAANDLNKTVRVWAHFTLMVVKDKVDPKRIAAVGDLLAHSKNVLDRIQAAQAIGMMGDKANSQIPRLVDALDDPDLGVAVASMVALARMGEDGLLPIASALTNGKKAPIRIAAARALGAIGAKAKSQIPTLVRALKDTDKQVVAASMLALAQIGAGGLESVSKLLLESKVVTIRVQAAQALGAAGPKAESQIPALVQALEDKDRSVTAASLVALAQIGKDGLGPVRKTLLGSKEAAIRIQAAQALGAAGPKAKSQVPALLQALGDSDNDVVLTCTWALAQMGRDAEAALPRLQAMAQNTDNQEVLRQLATVAINVIEGKAEAKKDLKKPRTDTR